MDTVRIGCVQYLNTLPLIEGLRTWKDCEIVTAVPANLIGMLRRGEVDVALASIIDAAQARSEDDQVVLLPVGMIGCDGPTLTVRVFSRTPIEKLDVIAADTDSHTSVALLRVIMQKKFGRSIRLLDFDAREHMLVGGGAAGQKLEGDWPEAVLLIGDKVVTDAPPNEKYPHQLDLGAAWKEMTGLPFVYAMWMCRAGTEDSTPVRTAAMMLDRARRHNAMRMDWLASTRAGEKGWPADLAAQYFGSYLKYEVDERERAAAEKFIAWAHELGCCNSPVVRWADAPVA